MILVEGAQEEAAIIQPKWPIEEYARRGRIWVWFNPPIPPTKALSPAVAIRTGDEEKEGEKVIILRGIIFCHVKRIRQIGHLIAFIT